jgi:flagellin
MPLSINTNAAASSASYYLSKNNASLQKSLTRLSSGSRITQPADDAGGLAVSMKLSGTINRLSGVEKNIDNAISFLQVQDGVLESAGKILDRMAELKALSQDVLKNDSDIANYDSEFRNLQVQLYQMSETTFNGVSLFSGASQSSAVFGGTNAEDVTVSIFTSATGESGSLVSINKSMLLSALTIDTNDTNLKSVSFATSTGRHEGTGAIATTSSIFSFAASSSDKAINLDSMSVAVFTQALENIASLRAENGGSVSRLQFAKESASQQKTNLEAANGRIMDVDIASESTRLAKYNILVQASASMLSQANATSNVAMMLLN